jgi:pimeloyl-ACP methyl ester carboxylesterase
MPMLRLHHSGDRDAPPLLLLHGLGGSHHTWDAVSQQLGSTFHLISPDLAGFGGSPRPRDLSIPAQARYLADTLDGIGARGPLAAVGHSMGGSVAAALAELRPELVDRLVLVNATPTKASRLTARTPRERILGVPVLGELLWRIAPERALRRGAQSAVATGAAVPEQALRDLRATTASALSAANRALDDYLAEQPLAERVAKLGVPTLLVFGDEDGRIDVSAFDAFTADRAVRLPGVGHSPPFEAPAAVAEAIRDWLR